MQVLQFRLPSIKIVKGHPIIPNAFFVQSYRELAIERAACSNRESVAIFISDE